MAGSIRGPHTRTIRRPGRRCATSWVGATAKFEERTSHRCAADGADHKGLRPIAKRRPKARPVSEGFEVEAKRIADKLDMFLGILAAIWQEDSKRSVSHVLGLAEEDGGVVPTSP